MRSFTRKKNEIEIGITERKYKDWNDKKFEIIMKKKLQIKTQIQHSHK